MMDNKKTVGCLEQVSFPELGGKVLWAKIDTGAFSGALHCVDVKVVRRNGVRVLKFRPTGSRVMYETVNFQSTYIRSATGHRIRRHVIDTVIALNKKQYPIQIGLSDRSRMKFPVLIGRRFLREACMTVDGTVTMKIPAGTQSGTDFKLSGHGAPHLRSDSRGAHIVSVIVDTPTKLSKKQRELLEDFGSAKKRGIFS